MSDDILEFVGYALYYTLSAPFQILKGAFYVAESAFELAADAFSMPSNLSLASLEQNAHNFPNVNPVSQEAVGSFAKSSSTALEFSAGALKDYYTFRAAIDPYNYGQRSPIYYAVNDAIDLAVQSQQDKSNSEAVFFESKDNRQQQKLEKALNKAMRTFSKDSQKVIEAESKHLDPTDAMKKLTQHLRDNNRKVIKIMDRQQKGLAKSKVQRVNNDFDDYFKELDKFQRFSEKIADDITRDPKILDKVEAAVESYKVNLDKKFDKIFEKNETRLKDVTPHGILFKTTDSFIKDIKKIDNTKFTDRIKAGNYTKSGAFRQKKRKFSKKIKTQSRKAKWFSRAMKGVKILAGLTVVAAAVMVAGLTFGAGVPALAAAAATMQSGIVAAAAATGISTSAAATTAATTTAANAIVANATALGLTGSIAVGTAGLIGLRAVTKSIGKGVKGAHKQVSRAQDKIVKYITGEDNSMEGLADRVLDTPQNEEELASRVLDEQSKNITFQKDRHDNLSSQELNNQSGLDKSQSASVDNEDKPREPKRPGRS